MSSVIWRALAISSPFERAISPFGRYRLSSRPTRIEPPSVSAAETSIHWSREIPITPQCEPVGDVVDHRREVARRRRDAADDAHHAVDMHRRFQHAHVDQRLEAADVPDVEALVLGFDPSSFIASSSSMISLNGFSNTMLKTNCLREREYLA